jgi:hypothetical protein
LVLKAFKESKVFKVHKAYLVLKVHRALKDHKESKAQKVTLAHKVHRALLAQQGHQVIQLVEQSPISKSVKQLPRRLEHKHPLFYNNKEAMWFSTL